LEGILILEPECCFTLTYGYPSCDFNDIVVECSSYVIEIWKDESFVHVKSYGNDIFCIFSGEFLDMIDCQIGSEEEFLVVGELDNEGDIKDIL